MSLKYIILLLLLLLAIIIIIIIITIIIIIITIYYLFLFLFFSNAMQSINGASLKQHWAAQHGLQEPIVAQRSSVYRTEL